LNRSFWGGLAVCVVLCSVLVPVAYGQEDMAPPKTARFCNIEAKSCNDLTWAGEYYEGRNDGDTKIVSRFWIKRWEKDAVEIEGKTAFAVQNGFPLEAFFHGKIAPDGTSIQGGTYEWRVGVGSSGTGRWTLTWSKAASNMMGEFAAGQFQTPRHSKTNPNILLPPGAAEVYASYPDAVRAILLPDNAITPTDAKRACRDAGVTQAAMAVEIARYAYRTGDMKRGDCWLKTAMDLGSVRAKVIYATTFLYGWQGTAKDGAKGFGILKANLGTKDPWDIWQLTQCYIDGTGTPKNAHEAAILTSYTLTHPDVIDVSQMVGADDEQLVHEFQRLSVMMNPPTTTKTNCQMVPVPGGNGPVKQSCTTTSTVDDKALERQLGNVDQNYQNKKNANP
jgi:hypothetical protein